MADILGDRDPAVPETPTRVSEPSRESQLPKRFYEDAAVAEKDGFYFVELDGRSVKTPGKSVLGSSSEMIAAMMASEWAAQVEHIDPVTMPVTRLINTCIDGVSQEMQAVQEDMIRYAGSDLLCYRAAGPDGLIEKQREHWDPLIDWAQAALGARFTLAEGVMYVEQPVETIAAFSTHVGLIKDPTLLGAAHVVMSLTGSAIIAMSVLKGEVDAETGWQIAHVDEDWNIEQWGEDLEASERREIRYRDMKAACDCIQALA